MSIQDVYKMLHFTFVTAYCEAPNFLRYIT